MSITKVSTVGMSREDWLKIRKGSIGGSDAAAIVGLNDYSSAYAVWAEKSGLLPEKEDNESMRQGRDLEEYVAQRFAEKTGKKVRRCNAIIYNDLYPFAHANIDRDIVGEDAGLECKTTSVLNMSRFAGGEYPANYYVQCQHYLAVTGKKKWYLAVLVLGREFMVFEIERDDDEIKALMDAERKLWDCVVSGEHPTVDGSKATSDAIKAVYSDSHPGTIDLFSRDTVIDEIMAIRKQIKELEQLQEERENIIKADLGSYESGTTDKFNVSWKQQTRRSFDVKRFAEVNPEINLAPYYNETAFRKFDIRKKKGA